MIKPPTLHRKAVSRQLARRMRLPESKARLYLDTLLKLLADHLRAGGKIQFDGFMTFEVIARAQIKKEKDHLGNIYPQRKIYASVRVRISRALRKTLPIPPFQDEE